MVRLQEDPGLGTSPNTCEEQKGRGVALDLRGPTSLQDHMLQPKSSGAGASGRTSALRANVCPSFRQWKNVLNRDSRARTMTGAEVQAMPAPPHRQQQVKPDLSGKCQATRVTAGRKGGKISKVICPLLLRISVWCHLKTGRRSLKKSSSSWVWCRQKDPEIKVIVSYPEDSRPAGAT